MILETQAEDFYRAVLFHKHFLSFYYWPSTVSGLSNTGMEKTPLSGFMNLAVVLKKLRSAQITQHQMLHAVLQALKYLLMKYEDLEEGENA